MQNKRGNDICLEISKNDIMVIDENANEDEIQLKKAKNMDLVYEQKIKMK